MNFGETLKKLRTRACKSRYRLAQYSGVHQVYILRLKREERGNPSIRTTSLLGLPRSCGGLRICKYLGHR